MKKTKQYLVMKEFLSINQNLRQERYLPDDLVILTDKQARNPLKNEYIKLNENLEENFTVDTKIIESNKKTVKSIK